MTPAGPRFGPRDLAPREVHADAGPGREVPGLVQEENGVVRDVPNHGGGPPVHRDGRAGPLSPARGHETPAGNNAAGFGWGVTRQKGTKAGDDSFGPFFLVWLVTCHFGEESRIAHKKHK